MSFRRQHNRPLPRGRRQWHAAIAVLLLCLAVAIVTVRAARRPLYETGILQPTDPGIITHDVGSPGR
ncbi:MAG TPA: hypothetical protein VGM51_16475 [Armatimonadota bacterium]|jgi:ferric-dicitrate binding protein FerR (iron transport regulator)